MVRCVAGHAGAYLGRELHQPKWIYEVHQQGCASPGVAHMHVLEQAPAVLCLS
jgi:hypothetical protein